MLPKLHEDLVDILKALGCGILVLISSCAGKDPYGPKVSVFLYNEHMELDDFQRAVTEVPRPLDIQL